MTKQQKRPCLFLGVSSMPAENQTARLQWQSIDGTPKDRPILVYCPNPVATATETYCWPDGCMLNVVLAHWHEPGSRSYDAAGWYAPWTDFYEFGSVALQPTHWMPLPPSP